MLLLAPNATQVAQQAESWLPFVERVGLPWVLVFVLIALIVVIVKYFLAHIKGNDKIVERLVPLVETQAKTGEASGRNLEELKRDWNRMVIALSRLAKNKRDEDAIDALAHDGNTVDSKMPKGEGGKR